jgi:hypothetical protein
MHARTTVAGDGEERRFRLRDGEPVPAGLRRIAGSQLDIERRRDELRRDAMQLAKRLFRNKPRTLVRPLEKAGGAA